MTSPRGEREPELRQRIATLLGSPVRHCSALSGGCISQVYRLDLSDGRSLVAKRGDPGGGLALEGHMLRALGEAGWPVPEVLHEERELLLLSFVASDGEQDALAEEWAADLIAARHAVAQPGFGFPVDTVIAGLPQSNRHSERWIPFFAEQRLLAMAAQARRAGTLPEADHRRIERLAGRLERWLGEPAQASLIHGDLWGGNILFHGHEVAAVIDPACYWADAEIELAFTTLFHTFGDAFYRRYAAHRPIAEGFFEERRDLYNLYPLLVHLRLFGGSYLSSLRAILKRFGV